MIQYIHVSETIYTNLLINFPAKNSPVPVHGVELLTK